MEEKKTIVPRRRMSPFLRKILLLLVLLLIPIFLAGAGFLVYSIINARESGRERIDTAVSTQLEDLDSSLSMVNLYLTETLMNNSLTKKINTEEDTHDRLVAARSLWEEFDRQNSLWAGNFNLFYYCPSRSLSVSRFDSGSNYSDNDAIRTMIKESAGKALFGESHLLWKPLAVNGSAYLLQIYTYQGNYVACWLSCSDAFSVLQGAVLSPNGLYVVLDSSYEPVLGKGTLVDRGIELDGGTATCSRWGEFCEVYEMHRADIRLLVNDDPYIDQENLLFLITFFCVTLLIILAFSLYTLTYFHRYIETPFQEFQQHVNDYASVRRHVKKRGFAELDEAVEAFDSLQMQLQELKIDVYEEKLALARTELEYFQLQIKPHFFVNCFSIIFGMAQKKDFSRIQEFCLKLSNYVRFLFRDGFTMVTLREELSVIREYLDIQNIRHRTENQMQDSIEEALLSREIPPLLLLTFVENAVKHAELNAWNLTVCILVSRLEEQQKLRFIVKNNGSKFPDEYLELLNDPAYYLDGGSHGGRGVGIRNIHKRLSLIYGNRFSLHFYNSDKGACVEILLPDEEIRPTAEMNFSADSNKLADK